MSRIDRIRRALGARRTARSGDSPAAETETPVEARLPVPVKTVAQTSGVQEDRRRGGNAEFAAHMLGQDGRTRGLRAGPLHVESAHGVYKHIEWSGSYDRRARKGRRARTEV